MAEEWVIVDVGEFQPEANNPCWYVTMEKPDGTLNQTFFPQVILEWRAAEYGLTDVNEILDMVLHELYQPREMPHRPISFVNTAKNKGAVTNRPASVWTAASTQEALTAYRGIVAEAKKSRVKIKDPSGHLGHLAARAEMKVDRIRDKTERVDINRWMKLYGGLPVEPEQDTLPKLPDGNDQPRNSGGG